MMPNIEISVCWHDHRKFLVAACPSAARGDAMLTLRNHFTEMTDDWPPLHGDLECFQLWWNTIKGRSIWVTNLSRFSPEVGHLLQGSGSFSGWSSRFSSLDPGFSASSLRQDQFWAEHSDTFKMINNGPLSLEKQKGYSSIPGWWFGCHFLFSHILGIIIPIDSYFS